MLSEVRKESSYPSPRFVEIISRLYTYGNPSCDLLEIPELLHSNTGWKSHVPPRGGSSWTKKL